MDQREREVVEGIGELIEHWIEQSYKDPDLQRKLSSQGRLITRFPANVNDHSYLESFLRAKFSHLRYQMEDSGMHFQLELTIESRDRHRNRKALQKPLRTVSLEQDRVQGARTVFIAGSNDGTEGRYAGNINKNDKAARSVYGAGAMKRTNETLQSHEPKRVRPSLEENSRQKDTQSDVGILANVAVHMLALSDDQAVAVESFVHGGGGRTVDVEDATHIVVGTQTAGIDLWRKVRGFKESCHKRIVSVEWLEEVITANVSPWDDNVASQFLAPFVQRHLVQSASVRNVSPRPKASQRPSISRRRATENLSVGYSAGKTQSAHQNEISENSPLIQASRSVERQPLSESPLIQAARSLERQPLSELQPCEGVKRMMTSSLSETMEFLKRERPDEVEAGELRTAIERSLLDSAVQLYTNTQATADTQKESPSQTLGVPENANIAEVRSAYRAKALQVHPDKGGDSNEFHRIRRAYNAMLAESKENVSLSGEQCLDQSESTLELPNSDVKKDFDLRNHKELVRQKFQQDGVDLSECIAKQSQAISSLHLESCELGATNTNERHQIMYNQCFYLSISKSFLGVCQTADLKVTALNMKRQIEAAVLASHADWAGHRVGEDVQAFSDFLFFALGANAILSDLAVVVFDSCSAGVEIYVGRHFPSPSRQAEQRANLLTILYVPGHYRALVPIGESPRPCLSDVTEALKKNSVHYVTTYV